MQIYQCIISFNIYKSDDEDSLNAILLQRVGGRCEPMQSV